ncbi:MAG: hypothetical protein LBF68_01130 [Christensenellaceae bacterium]|jgi:sporulation protein YabP|nr:hypothetical protein [Christensenellaceae bacterium]
MNDQNLANEHTLSYEKNTITITAVVDTNNFEENSICLTLSTGKLYIKGNNFSILEINLGKGIVRISGKLTSLDYKNTSTKIGLIKRLLK